MDDLNLHDFEILDLNINYSSAYINIYLCSSNNISYCLKVQEFKKFQINHEEPWGTGIYINASELLFNKNHMYYELTLELNSGDEISVISIKEPFLEQV